MLTAAVVTLTIIGILTGRQAIESESTQKVEKYIQIAIAIWMIMLAHAIWAKYL